MSDASTLPHLRDDAVAAVLSMPVAIGLMRTAFLAISRGEATVPTRLSVPMAEHDARALVMPSYLPASGIACVKWVNVNHSNPLQGLPMIHGIIMACDAATGRPLALLDAEMLTAIRTGAASGLATDLLAPPGAAHLAVFGSGAQARTQVEGVCAVRPIRRLTVFGRDRQRACDFAESMAARHALHAGVGDSLELLREADVICTATPSKVPLFPAAALPGCVHINAVGSYRPDLCEIGPDVLVRSRVVVDQRGACFAEAGELVQGLAAGVLDDGSAIAELGELIDAGVPARSARPERPFTLFKSVGNAVQDLVCVAEVLRRYAIASGHSSP
ncbi:ornithine cyclodeaminase family protein [Tahibacter amnicola]|uniref:Ornithine cyclodeaminase family protein n=1 Tax=Tahibacter amnicola TaxID=2976241 RepID=A0ABY6BI14_9GAMM|nr:ornithine cyclodeaminase family protein [Tahibacter amnicola]UXI68983.1 ornithine cyclodeaminase family protein [Tahibacter amnicola]